MQPTDAKEKELLKETLYRTKVKEMLRGHKGLLQNYPSLYQSKDSSTEEFERVREQYNSEWSILKRIITNESVSFFSGIAFAGVVFASVRFGPRFIIRKVGGNEKIKAMDKADAIAEKSNSRWVQKGTAFFFESMFGAWAGWRGYNMLSSQYSDSYEELSKVPLCAGRSVISDKICTDWIKLVHKEIPPAFWDNLKDGEECRLQDVKRWKVIRTFADNCVKRRVLEDSLRKQNGLGPGEPVAIPEGGVPNNILTLLQKKEER